MNASAKSCVNILPSLIYEHDSQENIFIDSKDEECTDKKWPNSPTQWGTAAHQGTPICWLSWDNPTFHSQQTDMLSRQQGKIIFYPQHIQDYIEFQCASHFTPILLSEVCWHVKAESAQLSVGRTRRTAAFCSSAGAWHWIKQCPNHHGLPRTTYYFFSTISSWLSK